MSEGTIKRMKVGGKPGTVAYFSDDMKPSLEDRATVAKIMYEDGRPPVFVSLTDKADGAQAEA